MSTVAVVMLTRYKLLPSKSEIVSKSVAVLHLNLKYYDWTIRINHWTIITLITSP